MATPCNSLNVQLIKVSDLASYNNIKAADQLMIIENRGFGNEINNSIHFRV